MAQGLKKDVGGRFRYAVGLQSWVNSGRGVSFSGEIESAPVFQRAYKPCVVTLEQLEENAEKQNMLVLSMTKPSESLDLDVAVLQETRDEISKGWADGAWKVEQLERGATISRRFPLAQGEKIRMIDDFCFRGE